MKKVFILFMLCICVGCTGKYELKINNDLSVQETITGLEDNKFYDRYYNSSRERVVDFVSSMFKEEMNNKGYSFSTVSEDYLYGGQAEKNYDNIDEYFNNSTVYEQYFESWDVKNDDGVITISLSQKKVGNGTGIDRAVVNDGTVSIILPFKVLDSNAKSKSGNTYTWNINSFKGKKIYIKFDSKHLEKSSYNNIVPIFIFSLLAIAVVIIIVIFLKRKNNSNSF